MLGVSGFVTQHQEQAQKGHKEDFDFEELEAPIELYKEHEEEDK